MSPEPMLYEMHMHTPLCKHARGEPEEYAEVALHRGLKGIVVTDHNPTNDGWSPETRMGVDELHDYVALVERARKAWAGRVDVRLGMESDYVPGMEPWLEKLHGMAEFHHVLGSVHPQLPQYLHRFDQGDADAFCGTYFEHLALAAETGLFDTIAHPDLVKNTAPADWCLERAMDHILPCLDRIAATGVAMELNTSGRNKVYAEMNPGPAMLAEVAERRIPVVIGADAHDPHRVGDGHIDALGMLHEAGYSHVSIFLHRRRQDLPIDRVRASLKAAEQTAAAEPTPGLRDPGAR